MYCILLSSIRAAGAASGLLKLGACARDLVNNVFALHNGGTYANRKEKLILGSNGMYADREEYWATIVCMQIAM